MLRKTLIIMTVLLSAPLAAHAATCSADLAGDDAMKYDKTNIDVPKSCKSFTINFSHPGKLAKTVMGHNVVIAKTSDVSAIDTDGMSAGAANDYVKPGDSRVIAHSKLIGSGEKTSATFPVAKVTDGSFSYFCSFPGHASMMKGTLTVK